MPSARSLYRALRGDGPGELRVVCQGRRGATSLRILRRSVRSARREGYRIRPSQPLRRLTARQARSRLALNRSLARRCRYRELQPAIDASGNNDHIAVMPGRYTEPRSRARPTNDPRCNPSMLQRDASGDLAPSYAYQSNCPNDQNLVYVQGREIGEDDPPQPPRSDRRGVPDEGPCVRCNLQIDGTGVKAEDVFIDAGTNYRGRERDPEAKPGGYAKHVVMRVDRADGFVGRDFLVRGGREFGFYTEETDGVLLDRTKFFWNADYGHLSFTTDHAVVRNCDGFGSGDSVVYPGAAPETGVQATKSFWPDAPRPNTVITRCDLRGSALGYSGSMGNAVRITQNHIYGNTTGIASDTLSSAGHPGFPADSSEIDNNLIYSNNFDIYRDDSPVKPLITVPIGTGIVYAGMNDARVHDNWIFDNWRDGARLFSVPDPLTSFGGPEGDVFPGVSCPGAPEIPLSTSCGNRFYNNKLGVAPPGFEFPAALDQFDAPRSTDPQGRLPNGVDFWWDEFLSNTGNCWYENVGPDGQATQGTGPGAGVPPDLLPASCPTSAGLGDVFKEAVLLDCAEGPDDETGPLDCPWWRLPPQPSTAEARREQRKQRAAAERFARSGEARALRERLRELIGR